MSSQHTPTPWIVSEFNCSSQTTAILGPVDKHGGSLVVCDVCEQDSAPGNAAFIVRACNAHDALVAALANLLREVDEAGLGSARDFAWPAVTAAARAALAKAGAA